MKRISEKWDDLFYSKRMENENADRSIEIEFQQQCDIVAAMEALEIEILQLQYHHKYNNEASCKMS